MADDDKEVLQRFVDSLFQRDTRVTRLDALLRAEALDVPEDLVGIVNLLPPGTYSRQLLCNQLNSSLKGHGWNGVYGTVE
jgi:hypothetical protein